MEVNESFKFFWKKVNRFVKGRIPASPLGYEEAFSFNGRGIHSLIISEEGFNIHLFLDTDLLAQEIADITKRTEKQNDAMGITHSDMRYPINKRLSGTIFYGGRMHMSRDMTVACDDGFINIRVGEISFFFYMKVPDSFSPISNSFTEDDSREFLKWVSVDDTITMYPDFFKTELQHPETAVKHFKTDER